jgi:hypothetical protein
MRAATTTTRSIAGRPGSPAGATAARSATRASPRRGRAGAAPRRDVYCYFDNDVKVHAPYDAAHLAARLGVATGLGAGDRFVPPPGLAPPRLRSPPFARREGARAR